MGVRHNQKGEDEREREREVGCGREAGRGGAGFGRSGSEMQIEFLRLAQEVIVATVATGERYRDWEGSSLYDDEG